MAKKPNFFNSSSKPSASKPAATPAAKPTAAPAATVSRNSPVPRPSATARQSISHEQIAKRAYEIFISGKGGSQDENWLRAERELRGA